MYSRAPRVCRAVILGALLPIGLAAAVLLTSTLLGESDQSLPRPTWLEALAAQDEAAYQVHAATGTAINLVGGSPTEAAMQWVKAAAHARSQTDLWRAADGIAAARQRGGGEVEAALCTIAAHGAPSVQVAIALGGLPCAASAFVRVHYPDGTPIEYGSRPPIGGPHYDTWHPSYGVSETPVPAGRWLHNLEHGAVVLLYHCLDECPALVEELRSLYERLPLGRNARSGRPRMLVTPYSDMEHRLAVVAWGHLLELDRLEPDRIVQFYREHVDRGPECHNYTCPE
jgi:hypothetical protein